MMQIPYTERLSLHWDAALLDAAIHIPIPIASMSESPGNWVQGHVQIVIHSWSDGKRMYMNLY